MTLAACPVCGTPTDRRLLAYSHDLRPAVAALAAATPGWTPAAGLCPGCAGHFSGRFARQRSATSLHTTSDPVTTFPYYHPAEETVLSQPQRLPDYATFGGAGVTIAFLDSGYYPHPDLAATPTWPGTAPAWQRQTPQALRETLRQAPLRLAEYVDLTDDGERVGVETASLWDDAGDSWHGQMTSVIAAGNGLLSDGLYRGFAPGAAVLPIKIGRGGGRIPEEDILRGLGWLLRDDNWQRYGVRVINISVGGDFAQDWQENPVCRAAHALAQRGVFIAAAAGNRGIEELLAPAQTPSVLTVGGVDDQNRRWRPSDADEVEHLALYHHNYGTVTWRHALVRKPELLAPARWLPSPVLPPSPVLKETHAIGRLRQVLQGEDDSHLAAYLRHWDQTLHAGGQPATRGPAAAAEDATQWMGEVWQALRRRMNAHKWVHPFYQHVDGTSVAVAQVSAVAAQMFEANPALTAESVRQLLVESSLALPHLLPRQTGAGLMQPALAVAAALRGHGGALAAFPRSGTHLRDFELQKWSVQGKLRLLRLENDAGARATTLYLGYYAPDAAQVSVTGSFNDWQPGHLALQPAGNGWWHAALRLPPGTHQYRFWIESATQAAPRWCRDPENPACSEGGYQEGHSSISL